MVRKRKKIIQEKIFIKVKNDKLHKHYIYISGSSICDADTGSGLVFKSEGLWYLRGFVSISLSTILPGGSIHCNNNLLYVTPVSSYIDWIVDIIPKLEQDQIYPFCPNSSIPDSNGMKNQKYNFSMIFICVIINCNVMYKIFIV